MIYCKKCRKKHRTDKSAFQIMHPINVNSVSEFIVHLARKHDLVDIKFFPFGNTPEMNQLLRILNTKDKLSRKEKKIDKKIQAAYNEIEF